MTNVLAGVAAEALREIAQRREADNRQDRYRDDPVGFCRDVLRFEPWSKQREILEAVRDHSRTAVRSCHGAGKTAIAARTALWFLAAFPNSRVITTAPTWNQVRDQLWREIKAAWEAAGGQAGIGGRLFDTRLEMGGDWFAVGLSTDKPERFQGHHAEHLLLVVDEASGVSEGIFEAASGYMTAHGARLLLIGNPTQLAGTFYRAFHSQTDLWRRIAISVEDTPAFSGEQVSRETLQSLPTRSWVELMRQDPGEESPVYEVRVLGRFPTLSDYNVIPLGEIEAAQTRSVEPSSPVVIACDVARFGSDQTVIAVRRGGQIRIERVLVKRDLMHVVGELLRVAEEVQAEGLSFPQFVIDDAGVGGGVVDRLREVRSEGGWPQSRVIAFNGGQRARFHDDYPNKRSELWFLFGQHLPLLDLDPDERLLADLVAPEYSLDSRGRRVVEAKEKTKQRLGRSPDRADAVLMTLAYNPKRPTPAGPEEDPRVWEEIVTSAYGSTRGEAREPSGVLDRGVREHV